MFPAPAVRQALWTSPIKASALMQLKTESALIVIIAISDSNQITFRVPPSLPSGQYLIRGEQIALHGELRYYRRKSLC